MHIKKHLLSFWILRTLLQTLIPNSYLLKLSLLLGNGKPSTNGGIQSYYKLTSSKIKWDAKSDKTKWFLFFKSPWSKERDKYVNNFYMLSGYSSAQKERWSQGRKTRTGILKANGRKCFKDYTEFHLQHNGKDSNSPGNENKVNSGTLKFHLGAVDQTKRGQDRKNEESKRRPTSKLWPLSVRVNKAKGGEEDKVWNVPVLNLANG